MDARFRRVQRAVVCAATQRLLHWVIRSSLLWMIYRDWQTASQRAKNYQCSIFGLIYVWATTCHKKHSLITKCRLSDSHRTRSSNHFTDSCGRRAAFCHCHQAGARPLPTFDLLANSGSNPTLTSRSVRRSNERQSLRQSRGCYVTIPHNLPTIRLSPNIEQHQKHVD